jgi:hypothetical protein
MMIHLGIERPFRQRPLQLVDQTVPAERGRRITTGQELITQLVRNKRGFACHARVPSVPSSWPAHGIPDSPDGRRTVGRGTRRAISTMKSWHSMQPILMDQLVGLKPPTHYDDPDF